MSTAKHTPGPWSVISEGMASPKVVDGAGFGICHTTYAPTGAEANARLISASPDLLEALKLVAPHIPGIIAMGWLSAEQTDSIRAAIAKAEGQS